MGQNGYNIPGFYNLRNRSWRTGKKTNTFLANDWLAMCSSPQRLARDPVCSVQRHGGQYMQEW